jgi:hypothetical protein
MPLIISDRPNGSKDMNRRMRPITANSIVKMKKNEETVSSTTLYSFWYATRYLKSKATNELVSTILSSMKKSIYPLIVSSSL